MNNDLMPMFPLGGVLLPGSAIPLQIFEPRYVTMVREQLAATDDEPPRFGVVLIERGREVGGGDVRASVATLATAHGLRLTGDGRYLCHAVGTERLRVDDWLPDDPYPLARVSPWPLERHDRATPHTGTGEELSDLISQLGAFRSDASGLQWSPNPLVAVYQLGAAAPIAELDRYRLLRAASFERAVEVLRQAFDDLGSVLKFRGS